MLSESIAPQKIKDWRFRGAIATNIACLSAEDDGGTEEARELLKAGTRRTIELWNGKERVAVLEKDNS